MRLIGVLDWRLAEFARRLDAATRSARSCVEPALLAALSAMQPRRRPDYGWRQPRRQRASTPSIAAALAEVYRQQPFHAAELAQALTARVAPALRRALLFEAAEAERTPFKRTRLVRAALDDARRAGLYLPMAAALARAVVEDSAGAPRSAGSPRRRSR